MIVLTPFPQPSLAGLIRERIELHREVIKHYTRFIREFNAMKRETQNVRELVAIAGCIDDCELAIERASREMRRLSQNRVLKEYEHQPWENP